MNATNSKDSLVVKQGIKRELPYEGQWEEKRTVINLNKEAKMLDSELDCTNKIPQALDRNIKDLNKGVKRVKAIVRRTKSMKNINQKKKANMLSMLNKKLIKIYQNIENVKAKVKITESMKKNQPLDKENLEKTTSNEDDNKADTKVDFCIEEPSIYLFLVILSKENAMELTRKDLNENTFYVMKRNHKKMKYAKVIVKDDQISFDEWEEEAELGSSCVDLFDFISSRTAVIDTHKFIEEHKQELHNPRFPLHRIKFSEIEVKGRGVYFGSFKTHNISDFVIKFGSLLKTLGCSFVVPEEVFFRFDTPSGDEVVITTDGVSPRALNFLLLTSGILDDSYLGTEFCSNNAIVAGGFKKGGYLFPGVVEGIRNRGVYAREEVKRGDIEGWYEKKRDMLSLFRVVRRDCNRSSMKTFGRVKEGMEVIYRIENEDVVKECGLLFNLN